MSSRARLYLATVPTAAVAGAYARLAGHWSDVAFYGLGAAVLAVVVLTSLFWIEFAPDGAFGQKQRR
jgi:hypothetical protein